MIGFRSNRLILLLAAWICTHSMAAGIRGRLANPDFADQPVKSAFFFTGNWRNGIQFYEYNPTSNIGLYTVHPADSRHLGWSEREEYREFAVQQLIDAGVNVINMSYWGPRGTDNWAYWAPMQTSTYSHDQLFDIAIDKPVLIAPYLESTAATGSSPSFSFRDCFPGGTNDPAPQLIDWIEDLVDHYLLHPSNPEWPEKWAKMTDLNGDDRYVISLIHVASNQTGMDPSAFAQGFDRVADKILSDTGIRIGFTIDALPPGTYAPGTYRPSATADGPDLAQTPSVLAVQCFLSEIWKGDSNESNLIAWKRQFASDWMESGIPFIFDATPGYDAHVVFPNSVIYGNNDAWWNAQLQLVRDLDPDGVTFNAWNGYTEGMAGMATLQFGEANDRWIRSLFTLSDSLAGFVNAVPGDKPFPSTFSLHQNYPNPFNPRTNIEYFLPKDGRVLLNIYNLTGQCIKTLVNERQSSGQYTIQWNGRDEKGRMMPSGVYLFKITNNDFTETKRMVLMK